MLLCVEGMVGDTLSELSLAGCVIDEGAWDMLGDLLSARFPTLQVLDVRGSNEPLAGKHLAMVVIRRRMGGLSSLRIRTA
mmetsp:Transcript_42120/g.96012  ORF Transcript_42120/g.96012 Transcript_42120/m.96012 type:complete len:80 (-) Transcript_42120:153-392(-)